MVRRLNVCYLVHRKNQFFVLVQVWSKPLVWFFPAVVVGTLYSYRNSCMRCKCYTYSWSPSLSRNCKIGYSLAASSLSVGVGNAALPLIVFFSSFGIVILSPAKRKPKRLVILLKTGENSPGPLSFWLFRTHPALQQLRVNKRFLY